MRKVSLYEIFLILRTDSWKQIYSKSYQVQKGAKTRSEAMAACKEKKGKLFEPRFATENVDVLEFLIDAGIKKIVWQYEAGRTRTQLVGRSRAGNMAGLSNLLISLKLNIHSWTRVEIGWINL